MRLITSLRLPILAVVWVPSLAACTLLIALFSLACETDAQRIREANKAAQQSKRTPTPEATSTPSPTPSAMAATMSVFDVRDGDCLSFLGALDFQDTVRLEEVELVECSGPWEARVLSSFVIDLESPYPGEDYFMSQWREQCDRRSTLPIYPLPESWALGDRTVNCLQERFGQAEPSDSVVLHSRVNTGECFNDVLASEGIAVELVPCTNANWTRRVLNTFDVPVGGPYPGESYFAQQAEARCNLRYEYYVYPIPETWAYGDRSILCLQGK